MVKLHIGCGWRNFGKDWIHIDNGNYEHLDYQTDVATLSMFEENSVDLIYASHVIAYFNRNEIVSVFNEWNRVLKKNGTLRLATPDFESMVQLYYDGKIILEEMLGPLYGKMEMNSIEIYHKTTYDLKSLESLLLFCGFDKVKKYNWQNTEHSNFDDHSQAYKPHMDKENGKLISLNIEAIKI